MSLYPFVSEDNVINKAEVSPKSLFAIKATTPGGKVDLNSFKPCFNLDQTRRHRLRYHLILRK